MTLPESATEAIRNLDPAPEGDNGAPNECNPIGAMNRIEQIAQIIEDCGYSDDTDPDSDRQAEFEEAWWKFKYRIRLISKDIAGKGDAMEVEVKTGTDADGNPVLETEQFGNPNGPVGISVETVELPDRTAHAGGGL